MKIKISHITEYKFSVPVFLEPHYFRLKPRHTPTISPATFRLKIEPSPAGLSEFSDAEGNFVSFCWFDGLKPSLKIEAESIVESGEFNPFNFLVYPNDFLTLPFSYPDTLNELLSPSLIKEPISKGLREFGESVLEAAGHNTVDFLSELTKKIHAGFDVVFRESGQPLAPDETFTLKRASCRDLSWMQIQLLRNMGVACRFVSGYFYLPLEEGNQFELHAWLEIYLPGAGWLGFDPSHGIVTGQNHIPVASSAFHKYTLPIDGSFRGSAEASLHTDLEIVRLDGK